MNADEAQKRLAEIDATQRRQKAEQIAPLMREAAEAQVWSCRAQKRIFELLSYPHEPLTQGEFLAHVIELEIKAWVDEWGSNDAADTIGLIDAENFLRRLEGVLAWHRSQQTGAQS